MDEAVPECAGSHRVIRRVCFGERAVQGSLVVVLHGLFFSLVWAVVFALIGWGVLRFEAVGDSFAAKVARGVDEGFVRAGTDAVRSHAVMREFFVAWQWLSEPWRVYACGLVVLGVLWWWRRAGVVGAGQRVGCGVVGMMWAWLLAAVVKWVVARPRPVVEPPVWCAEGFSFPSGHAANATAVVCGFVFVLWPFLGWMGRVGVLVGGVLFVVVTVVDRVMLGGCDSLVRPRCDGLIWPRVRLAGVLTV
ncbi:PAP2 superfamily [Dermatophilus congolensis]|uniref:PAP2 superfamily n=1 Tax=Dermatophilus congolensis TaxID=1863 RepID=A0AA46BQB3_9MICO|nr:PAP2 superfamily [Dermatophilus congolensis]